jgi:hypothetical protein
VEQPKRRRTDGPASADGTGFAGAPLSAERWVRRCIARMRELDPQIALEDAEEIALEMYEFERTGVMEPEAAVDFVGSQMLKEPLARLERRGARREA